MKIYSWNILFRNSKLDRAFDFVKKSDFDLFCLQEVPQHFLDRLRTLPCHVAYTVDIDRLSVPNYLVILSRYPISREARFPFPDYWPHLPLRTRLFMHLSHPFYFSKIRNRSGHFADIKSPRGMIRIFNLHLILAHPSLRLKEFEIAMAERDPDLPTIVCGDFNILEAVLINIFNWLLGGTVTDALLHRRERITIEERFVTHEFTNALRGEVTHPLSQSQLDHILIPPQFSIQEAQVLPDRTGSDHHPIYIEVS